MRFRDPKHHLFFTRTTNGHGAARAFLVRLKERTVDRDAHEQLIDETLMFLGR